MAKPNGREVGVVDKELPDLEGVTDNREAMALYEADGYCGARRNKRGGRCQRPAGWGTDHVGQGRCKFHGGATPIRHGRYSSIKRDRIKDLYETYKEDPDPLNMLDEVHMLRALATDFIERYDEWAEALTLWWAAHTQRNSKDPMVAAAARLVLSEAAPRKILDVADAYRIVSEVTKVIKRIEDVRSQNAISRADMFRILREMGKTVRRYNDEPDPERRIKLINRDWDRIKL